MKNVSLYIVVSSIAFWIAALLITFAFRLGFYQAFDFTFVFFFVIGLAFALIGAICCKKILTEKKNNPDEKIPKSAKITTVIMAIPTVVVIAIIIIFIMIWQDPSRQLYFM